MNKSVLKLENISREFIQGTTCIEVLKNINIELMRGEITAIIGASGSGKSTLLQIAGLLDKASAGEIYFKNKKTSTLSESQKTAIRLKNMGYVYQYHHLLRDFSARENIAMPLLIAGQDYNLATEKADKFLEKLGMYNRRCNYPGQLSGGEQQRVAIARAIVTEPDLIFADEPTGNLDPANAKEVFEIFLKLVKDTKAAILLVTHNHELAKSADKIVELKATQL